MSLLSTSSHLLLYPPKKKKKKHWTPKISKPFGSALRLGILSLLATPWASEEAPGRGKRLKAVECQYDKVLGIQSGQEEPRRGGVEWSCGVQFALLVLFYFVSGGYKKCQKMANMMLVGLVCYFLGDQ